MSAPRTLRVLILEDQPTDLELLLDELRQSGFEPEWRCVESQADFLANLREDLDLILADYTLPQFNALQALHGLQQSGLDIPFIVVTGTVSEEVAVECMKQGASDYLLKDRMARLGQAVVKALEDKRLRVERRQAEEALRKSEQQYRLLAENILDVIWIVDNDFKFTYISPSVRYLRGYEPEEAMKQTIEETMPPDSYQIVLDGYAKRLEAESRGQMDSVDYLQIQQKRKDGSLVWVEKMIQPILNGEGQRIGLLGVSRDITERKRAEEAEHEQRLFAEALYDTAAAINSSLNLDEVMDRILANIDRVVPRTPAIITLIESGIGRIERSRGYTELVPERWLKEVRFPIADIPNLRRMMETGEPYLVPDTAADPDWVVFEETRWIRSSVGAPIQMKGEVIGCINLSSMTPASFTLKDAERLWAFADQAAVAIANAQLYETLRQYAAELEQRVVQRTLELSRAKEHAEAILNNSGDAILVTGKDGRINRVNPAFRAFFGYADDEAFALPLTALAEPESASLLAAALDRVTERGLLVRIELTARRKDGTSFDAELALAPVFGDGLSGLVCNVRDITQRKQMEQELRKTLEQEKELNELKSRFVAMVSHEFRAPLSVILSAAGLVKTFGHKLTEEQKLEQLSKIHSSVGHMVTLLEDILTLSQAESGKRQFNPAPLDLAAFCERLVEDTRLSTGETHHFALEISGACSKTILDEFLLQEIFINLLSNAVKYSPAGSTIHFGVTCEERQVVFQVQDEGIGIPLEDQKHLFESFFRASNVTKIHGTGLGLVIARQAVELHGGTITFESQVDVGTTFIVTLPGTTAL